MSEEYPLYPNLSEDGKKEAQEVIDSYKGAVKKLFEAVLGGLYTNVAEYIETDSWTNFRNTLLEGLCDYRNSKRYSYDFEKIRRAMFEKYKEEIIKDLNEDLVRENETLKGNVETLRNRLEDSAYRGR